MRSFLLIRFLLLTVAMSVVSAFGQTIVIDPGHGGTAYKGTQSEQNRSSPNNATTPGGIREKDLTLEFSKALESAIFAEAKKRGRKVGVVLTRRIDKNLNFTERAQICAKSEPSAIISVHFNASTSHRGLGSLCVIRNSKVNANFQADKAFADGLSAACSAGVRKYVSGSKSKGSIQDGYLHGGRGSNFFFQLARHKHLQAVPKCFLEVEHIDRADVEASLLKKRKQAFPDIARGIAVYLLDQL